MAERVRKPLTPPINAAGNYVLFTPYSVPISVIYECYAIRNFDELAEKGIDVYKTYYAPFNLADTIYKEDAAMQAAIVFLHGANGTDYAVPNTYIQSYPGDSGIVHHNIVVGLELGLLPSTFDVSYITPLLIDVVKQHVGVETEAMFATVPYEGTVSHDKFVQMERSRIANIKSYKTIYQQLQEALDTNANVLAQQTDLLTVISQLQSENEGLTSRVASITASASSDMAEATARNTALEKQVAALETEKTTLTAKVAELNDKITYLTTP